MRQPGRRVGPLLAGVAVIAATGLTVPTTAAAAPAAGTTGATETYLVLSKGSTSPANAASTVKAAGGTVVADYAKIGVLVARSDNTAFGDRMRADTKVEGATATAKYATRLANPAQEGAEAGGAVVR